MGKENKAYHDVTVTERTDVTPSGKVIPVYRVSATSKKGTYFTISVSEADFSKEKVDQLLTEKAQLIDSIQEL